jgi:predicted ATP-grasp superfamily ATP-dependent carboligase
MTLKAAIVGDLDSLRSFTNGLPTVLITDRPEAIRSRWCKQWRLLPKGYGPDLLLETLITLGKDSKDPLILFYCDDATLLLISRNRAELSQYYKFNLPPEELIEACTSKLEFVGLATKCCLPAPAQLTSEDIQSPRDIEGKLNFPVILKPGLHIGWHAYLTTRHAQFEPSKVLLANDMQEFITAFGIICEFAPDFVVQEYIHGNEDSIYSFHTYVSKEGVPLTWYVGRKIRTYPTLAGESSYIELIYDDEVVRLGLEIIRKLGVLGPVKIDFKKDAVRNEYYLLELNLRFNLWNHLGSACGINLPQVAYHDICGLDYQVVREYRTGMRWINFVLDCKAFFRELRPAGLLGFGAWLRSLMAPKVCHIFSWRDPYPFVYYCIAAVIRKVRAAIRLKTTT